MDPLLGDIDPYAHDPARWGASLASLAEIVVACLDAAEARTVVEIGAFAGDLTRVLADRVGHADGRVWAIDPFPQESLVRLAEERPELELVGETSLAALPRLPAVDAVIVDGDHNYFTVTQELRLVTRRASGADMPLLILHDVCWPHGRRDDYYAPEQIPEDSRQPIAEEGGLFPGVSGTRAGGLPYRGAAAREGGPRNGVLTAVEEMVARDEGLRLALVPAFFGLGAVWHSSAPWAGAVAAVLEPWDRNPVLERLEANRVLHLATVHDQYGRAERLLQRNARQQALLSRLLESSAFTVAERLSRLRHRAGIATAQSVVSKDDIRRVLAD